ncbi:MAG TPA: DivIVA domain-containing protein [Actinomycetota bacterium]|jgi:DivIVA domain-containing protein|nr:DivIVA domain-containing protein [Actinomycetota bacterium]
MPGSPDDFKGAFRTRVLGYDRADVDAFLSELAADYAAALAELEALKQRPAEPDAGIGEEIGKIVRQAREAAENLRTQAEQQTARILEEAERESANRVEAATREAENIVAQARAQVEHLYEMQERLAQGLGEAIATARRGLEMLEPAQAERVQEPPPPDA